MKNKKIKLLLGIIFLLVLIFLVKNNVKMTKEKPVKAKESSKVTKLNVGSNLVETLYNSLNLKLVNNNCDKEDKCLINEGYSFLYFTEEKEKILSDDEKMYLAINDLYKRNALKNISQEDKTSYYIDNTAMDNELINLFGNKDLSNFNYTFKPDPNCGIIEYIYSKDRHEINTNQCVSSNEKALTKIEDAYKEEDNIYIKMKVFKYEYKDDNIVIIKTIHGDEIDSYEMTESSKDMSEFFVDDRVDTYDFEFKIIDGNYYLQRILHS